MYTKEQIADIIRSNSGHDTRIKFEQEGPHKVKAEVTTQHPRVKEEFLLVAVEGENEAECLKKISAYIDSLLATKPQVYNQNTYTVMWRKMGSHLGAMVSYFSGQDVYEVLDKFYYNKNKEEYIIDLIKLNPIA